MPDTSPSPPRSTAAPPQASSGHDVFVSYAFEDKKVARRLARDLERLGFKVWFDETEITVGDSLRDVIDRGLRSSKFGVVILSPSFFKKSWTQYELDGLLAKSL
jgi:predicted nucleotide-binding protein